MLKHFAQFAIFPAVCLPGIALQTLLVAGFAAADDPRPRRGTFLSGESEPVLEKILRRHSEKAKEIKGGQRLDTRLGLRSGGDSGPVVVEGKPDKSRLVQAIRHEGDLAMPPEKPKLSAQTIADFVKWVEIGAPDPRQEATAAAGAAKRDPRQHWSFQPIRRSTPLGIKEIWPQSPLDTFI
jgi:hypothetical protein